jgi:hypothetical protein
MKAKLIKRENHYDLFEGTRFISTTECEDGTVNKLSKQNCDEMFGIPDADALAKQFAIDEGYDSSVGDLYKGYYYGFNKVLKLNETKVFTMKDMVDCWNTALKFQENKLTLGEFIQSLKPTEIEVEVEMDILNEYDQPKLDANGCLMLKQQEQ